MKIYTIKDIAQKAGVSVTTVSRVLNKRPDVNQATREKVERVMAEHHFVGNANARGLKQVDSDVVAIILRGHQNPFLNALAEAMLAHTQDTKYSFVLEFIDEKADEFQTALRLSQEKRAKGFIFAGSRIDERSRVLSRLDTPIVFATANAGGSDLLTASTVTVDERAMGRLAMDTLLDKGHRKIAIFGGSRSIGDNLALRYEGAAVSAGVPSVLSPAACVPYLVRSVAEGYLLEYGSETIDGLDCLRCAFDTTTPDGSRILCTVWLERESGVPCYTEFSTDGAVVLTIRTLSFTMKEKEG